MANTDIAYSTIDRDSGDRAAGAPAAAGPAARLTRRDIVRTSRLANLVALG
jgi:hypothetical protein